MPTKYRAHMQRSRDSTGSPFILQGHSFGEDSLGLTWRETGLKDDTGSKIRWKRPILSTTQASCWGTKRTTVFMGKLDAHRCCAGVTHNLGAVLWVCYRNTQLQQLSVSLKTWDESCDNGVAAAGGRCSLPKSGIRKLPVNIGEELISD
ncbi:hypothetical protein INR49_023339 [Caranx melampygus]|nr:hypothetical protein INR49_023339 [Caranx melampygus]